MEIVQDVLVGTYGVAIQDVFLIVKTASSFLIMMMLWMRCFFTWFLP